MYDLDTLKKEYIGKEFNWLTVIDVIRDSGKPIEFICKCRCGKEVTRRWDKVKSGHFKSCGCYRKSDEMSACKSQWFKDNPDKVAECSKKLSQWYKDNPDKVALRGAKHSQWFRDNHDAWISSYNKRLNTYANNPEIANNAKEKYLEWCRANPDKVKEISKQGNMAYVSKCALHRQSANFSCLGSIVRDDFVEKLYTGEIRFNDLIFVKCSACGEYSPIRLGCIFDFNTSELINNGFHLCRRCCHTASSYEQEIADFVSTFYSGQCVRNTRGIISPLELDLYYPEKKIAIEFNGDYWHDENHKPENYHYNKFYKCLESGIILVSIFNYYWHKDNDSIKEYLFDLFNNNENSLSFYKDQCINNNYPTPWMSTNHASYNASHYEFCGHSVYTCGYSLLHS